MYHIENDKTGKTNTSSENARYSARKDRPKRRERHLRESAPTRLPARQPVAPIRPELRGHDDVGGDRKRTGQVEREHVYGEVLLGILLLAN